METQIRVAVYQAEADDLPYTRAAEIRATFPDGSTTRFHAIGNPGSFKFEKTEGAKPIDDIYLVRNIKVGQISGQSKNQILDVFAGTPVNNSTEDTIKWSSLSWVAEALIRLFEQGWIKNDEKASAILGIHHAINKGPFRVLEHKPISELLSKLMPGLKPEHLQECIKEHMPASMQEHMSAFIQESIPGFHEYKSLEELVKDGKCKPDDGNMMLAYL